MAPIIGTLSKDNGSQDVGKKMNLRSFKLNRVDLTYLNPLNMSNEGDFSWCWILNEILILNVIRLKKRKENSSSYVHILHKTANSEVSRRSCAMDVEEMY